MEKETTVEFLVKFPEILGKSNTTSSKDVIINSINQGKVMTDKEKAVIIIDLIEKVTQEIIDKPLHRKKYLQMRGHLEKAVKLTGNGIKREWSRPPSLPIFQHEKGTAQPFTPETSGDVLADNSPEPTRKVKKK